MASANNSDRNKYSDRSYIIPGNVAYMPNGIRNFLKNTYREQNQKDERLRTWYNYSKYNTGEPECLSIIYGEMNNKSRCILSSYQEYRDVNKIDTCIFYKMNDGYIQNWTASITPNKEDDWKLNNNFLLQSKNFDELIEFFLEKEFIINYFFNGEKAFSIKLWQIEKSIRIIFILSEQDNQSNTKPAREIPLAGESQAGGRRRSYTRKSKKHSKRSKRSHSSKRSHRTRKH